MKASRTLSQSTVGFIYEVPTKLQSTGKDLLFNFSNFERKVMMEDEGYALGR